MANKNACFGNESLLICPMKREDVALFMHWGNHRDPLYSDYNFPQMSPKEQEDWFAFKHKGRKRCFTIWDRASVQPVGYLSLRNVRWLCRQAELGIVLDPDQIDQGYGTLAIRLFLCWFFTVFKYKKLILRVAAYNQRAYHVYQKLGFVHTKSFYDHFYNYHIDPFSVDYRDIQGFFRRRLGDIEVLYHRMEISTKSTSKNICTVDKCG